MNEQKKEMELIYVNQSFENDVLDVQKQSKNGKDLFVLAKGNKPVVKCEIVF